MDLNVWSIYVEPNEWSTSSINIYDENGAYIQYGWMVKFLQYFGINHVLTFVFSILRSYVCKVTNVENLWFNDFFR